MTLELTAPFFLGHPVVDLTSQWSFPTPPAQIMLSVMVPGKSARAVAQVSLVTTETSVSNKTPEETPPEDVVPHPWSDIIKYAMVTL